MLFNSFAFAVFLPIVLVLYFVLSHRWQNLMLLIASYVFYGYWDWRFLSLLAISTVADYFIGLKIYAEPGDTDASRRKRKAWLIVAMTNNLAILGFFKYFNFFIDSFAVVLGGLGFHPGLPTLNIILPVGISFYTFQTMSYTIDVYYGHLPATRKFIDFALYVAFFPQLVAGPIERAKDLLPRVLSKRVFNKAQFIDGLHFIFWGLFKKVFVADNLAPHVDRYFSAASLTGWEVLMASYYFAWQVYCDFSGYSDIARGLAKLMGFELMLNFNHPYVATNPSDFWKRWHISLSSWLKDYLYIPLGGNRGGVVGTYRNLSLTMLLGGLWHGANWIFVLWGGFHGALLIAHRLLQEVMKPVQKYTQRIPHAVRNLFKIIVFFHIICASFTVFRSQSISQIADMITSMVHWNGEADWSQFLIFLKFTGLLMIVELVQVLLKRDDLNNLPSPVWVKAIAYSVVAYLLVFYGAAAQAFIYFQF